METAIAIHWWPTDGYPHKTQTFEEPGEFVPDPGVIRFFIVHSEGGAEWVTVTPPNRIFVWPGIGWRVFTPTP